jgi:hypothetical protein
MTARGGEVTWGITVQAARSRARFPFMSLEYNPTSRTVTLGTTQPLTEMSTSDVSWGVKAAGVQG